MILLLSQRRYFPKLKFMRFFKLPFLLVVISRRANDALSFFVVTAAVESVINFEPAVSPYGNHFPIT